jgi:hypothetical protein
MEKRQKMTHLTIDSNFSKQWLDTAIANSSHTPSRVTLRRQGWDFLRYDCSIIDAPLTLAGKVFKRGLGTHADSEIRIRANQPIREFRAWGFFLRLVRTDLNLTAAERHSGDICVPNIKENDHA